MTEPKGKHQVHECLRCGEPVLWDRHGPGVAMCPGCGAEVAFAAASDGGRGDRVALADPTHPHHDAADGEPQVECQACGAHVPLRGVSHHERTGDLPGDLSDTVTCHACGVQVPIDV